jgi:hypothetical protein
VALAEGVVPRLAPVTAEGRHVLDEREDGHIPAREAGGVMSRLPAPSPSLGPLGGLWNTMESISAGVWRARTAAAAS